MAAGIRFTKAERALVEAALEAQDLTAAPAKVRQSVLDKFEKADLLGRKRSTGIPVATAIAAFRGVLGNRLVLPPNPGPGWYAQISRRLSDLGVTVGDCTTIAKVAAEKWRGYIKADSLIRQAEVLLQEAQLPLPYSPVNARRVGSDMEDL